MRMCSQAEPFLFCDHAPFFSRTEEAIDKWLCEPRLCIDRPGDLLWKEKIQDLFDLFCQLCLIDACAQELRDSLLDERTNCVNILSKT